MASKEPEVTVDAPGGAVLAPVVTAADERIAAKRARIETDAGKLEAGTSESLGKPFRNPMIGKVKKTHPRQQQSQLLVIKQLEMALARLQDGQRIIEDCMIEEVEMATEKWVQAGRQVMPTTHLKAENTYIAQ
jgi:hypothetical protein